MYKIQQAYEEIGDPDEPKPVAGRKMAGVPLIDKFYIMITFKTPEP